VLITGTNAVKPDFAHCAHVSVLPRHRFGDKGFEESLLPIPCDARLLARSGRPTVPHCALGCGPSRGSPNLVLCTKYIDGQRIMLAVLCLPGVYWPALDTAARGSIKQKPTSSH